MQRVGTLVLIGFLGALTTLFGLGALVSLAEAFGPSSTEEGRVLERQERSSQSTRCFDGAGGGSRLRCTTVTVPSGVVAGELRSGGTWTVVDLTAYDNAPTPGTDVDVTTSSLTGRITGFDEGGSFGDSWSRTGSFEFWGVVIFGLVILVGVGGLLVALFTGRGAVDVSGRGPVVAIVVGAVVGLVGLWWLFFGSQSQYEPLTSDELYGGEGIVADPFEFISTADEAEEAGRVVETPPLAAFDFEARILTTDEIGDVAASIPDGQVPVVVVVEGLVRQPPFVVVRTSGPDGVVDAAPCSPEIPEYPIELSADQSIAAAVFCLDERPADGVVLLGDSPVDEGGIPIQLPG